MITTRAVSLLILGAVVIGSVGYYIGRETTTRSAVPSAPASEPSVPSQPVLPSPLDDLEKAQRANRGPGTSSVAGSLEVEEFNRNAARTQALPPSHTTAKMARVGDGVVIVNFRPSPETTLNRSSDGFQDDNKSPGFFEPLAREAAAGSDYAAHQLWQSLHNCERAPTTEAELRTSLAEAKKRFAQTGGATPFGTTLTYEQALNYYQSKYDRCQGVELKMYDEALEYLHQAADRGADPALRIEYASAIMKSNPADSRKRFESLWEEGHLAGLAALGQDSVAHRLAWYAATIAHFEGLPEPNPLPIFFHTKTAELRNEVSPSEYEEAVKEAARLLRTANCCIDP